MTAGSRHALRVRGLTAGYRGVPMVRDLSLEVEFGQIVALMGPNGAGKTTSILAIAGALPPSAGTVEILGRDTANESLAARVRRGTGLLTDDRAIFHTLTTRENLRLGRGEPARALAVFPELERLLDRRAGLLSGGEQQMLGLGRILAARPRLLLADELSLGLSPVAVDRLYRAVTELAADGCGVLLVEQQAHTALAVAHHGYVLSKGTVALAGTAAQLRLRGAGIESSYLAPNNGPPPPGRSP
ncbi:ABC transporter ATP-binding protein [Micromonospora marina]|uniref:ABC transporter ATP-binding protein n=1 Tax=Micromonospora marina TaxID=307120 RepID=UPI003454B10F